MKLPHLLLVLLLLPFLTSCGDGAQSSNQSKSQKVNVQKQGLTKEEKLDKLRKDAEAGNANAQYQLGYKYNIGEDVAKDTSKAFEWFQKSADKGFPDAQLKLGIAYKSGDGVAKNDAKAIEYYEKAAENGHSRSQLSLGIMYLKGDTPAYNWSVLGTYYTADMPVVPQNKTKALELIQKAAVQDDVAQQFLGHMYFDGVGVPKDIDEAVKWLVKAADQGDAEFQFGLGFRLRYGLNDLPQRPVIAADLIKKSALQGNVSAQNLHGQNYYYGVGVPKDAAKAFEWLQKAAAQGIPRAMSLLGEMYSTGNGVTKNLVLGYAWANLAAAKGSDFRGELAQARDNYELALTPEQRAEGQRLASNWKKGETILAAGEANAALPSAGNVKTKQSTGTGFIVSAAGHTLTNHHVIQNCREVRVAGQEGVARVVTSDTVNDLALLHSPVGSKETASITNDPGKLRQGEDILVFGYPLDAVLSSGGNLTPGVVSALSGLGNNTNQIQITAPIQPGSSGSPVMDKKGHVVGVVSQKLSDTKTVKATGSIPQNVNFAVNGQTVRAFLEANKVPYQNGGSFFAFDRAPADIAENARKWTVIIECWN